GSGDPLVSWIVALATTILHTCILHVEIFVFLDVFTGNLENHVVGSMETNFFIAWYNNDNDNLAQLSLASLDIGMPITVFGVQNTHSCVATAYFDNRFFLSLTILSDYIWRGMGIMQIFIVLCSFKNRSFIWTPAVNEIAAAVAA
ncbi:hypothetical protein ACJX0J_012763, partial [Zea mays]